MSGTAHRSGPPIIAVLLCWGLNLDAAADSMRHHRDQRREYKTRSEVYNNGSIRKKSRKLGSPLGSSRPGRRVYGSNRQERWERKVDGDVSRAVAELEAAHRAAAPPPRYTLPPPSTLEQVLAVLNGPFGLGAFVLLVGVAIGLLVRRAR